MPINSVITNSNAMMALRHLNDTNRQMAATQGRISTGLKINNAIDDSSNYTIAQGLRSDVKAMSTISQGLNNTKGAAQVALAGANSVSNLLADVRAKLVEMSNEGISASQRSILATDLNSLMSQVGNFISNAEFNGQNILTATSTNILTLSNINGGQLTLNAQDIETDAQALATVAAAIAGATASASALAGSFVTLETTVNAALGGLGADIRAINLQNEFLGQVRDATEEGLGNIIDADMARESAKLSSLQIRQELGMQVTGIANTAPQSLLGLFK
ncbi:MAG: flagellin [Nisaea sp.]|jgi:flagellin|nr:flagellin [Nisaea sp.]OUY01421.1 MAG: flagellin [Candidatus Endolissoclinum sp. TMED26]